MTEEIIKKENEVKKVAETTAPKTTTATAAPVRNTRGGNTAPTNDFRKNRRKPRACR